MTLLFLEEQIKGSYGFVTKQKWIFDYYDTYLYIGNKEKLIELWHEYEDIYLNYCRIIESFLDVLEYRISYLVNFLS